MNPETFAAIPRRKLILYVLVTVGILLLVTLLYLWATYGLVKVVITKQDNITFKHKLVAVYDDMKEVDVSNIGELYLIPRSAKIIKVSAGQYVTTRAQEPLPYFGVPEIRLTLQKDKTAAKIASDSPGCLTYNAQTNAVLSYDCTTPAYLLHFNTTTWQNDVVQTMARNIYTLQPFQGGIIGIEFGQENSSPLFTIDPLGVRNNFNLPDQIEEGTANTLTVITSPSSNNPRYVLKKPSGDVYYGEPGKDMVEFKAPKDFNSQFDKLACSLTQAELICYSGASGEAEDSEEASEHRKQHPNGNLRIINLATKEEQNFTVDLGGIDSLATTEKGHVYGLGRGTLYSLRRPGQANIQPLLVDKRVDSIAAMDNLYFTKENTIYKSTDSLESFKVFASSNLNLSSVYVLDNTVLFNAYVQKEATTNINRLHTFRLTNDNRTDSPQSIIDILPLTNSQYLLSNDYNEKTIYLQVFTSVTSDRASGTTLYDEQLYEANKSRALSELESLGINIADYTIVYGR